MNSATRIKKAKTGGTVRWPSNCEAGGEWIKLPKVMIRRLGALKLQPQHLWLLLRLQCVRFEDNHPRAHWEALAKECGRTRDTVRKWGYELRKNGLLTIRQNRKRDPDHAGNLGWRNDMNTFVLSPFLKRLEEEQATWVADRNANRPRKKAD